MIKVILLDLKSIFDTSLGYSIITMKFIIGLLLYLIIIIGTLTISYAIILCIQHIYEEYISCVIKRN